MIIDSHAHVGDRLFFGLGLTVAEVLERAAETGIEKTIVSSWKALRYDMFEGNHEVAQWTKQFDGRLYGYVAVSSPRFGWRARDEIHRGLEDHHMVGVKVYSGEQFPLSDPYMLELLAHVAELGVPVLAHTSGKQAAEVARQIPSLKLIMSHTGTTLDPGRGDWHWAVKAAQQCPNIYLETSGSSPILGLIEAAVEAVGPERVLFGTDLPAMEPHVQLAKVTDADIDERSKALLLGGNAARLFNL